MPRVRRFLDFAVEVFRELEAGRERAVVASPRPVWLSRPYGRSSAAILRSRHK